MAKSAEVKRQDALRFVQALRLQRSAGESLITADAPWSPTMALLLGSSLPGSCVAAVWEGRRAVALAQLARQSGRDQWEMMHLAVTGLESTAPLDALSANGRLLMLLDEVCRLAVTRRITAIIVRVPEQSWLATPLLRAGFSVTMQEQTYAQSPPVSVSSTEVPGLRLQEKHDAWPLHRLYLQSAPQLVRLTEGRTARDWQLKRSASRSSFHVTRWVVEGEVGLKGWLTEMPGRKSDLRIQIGVASGERQLASDLLATAMERAKERQCASVWSRVPAYAADVHKAFLDRGFLETGCDLVMKRSLAIRARDVAPAQARRDAARNRLATTQSRMLAERAAAGGATVESMKTGR